MERKERKMFENRPGIRKSWNFRVIIGGALKIIEETSRRIESLLVFTNCWKDRGKTFFTDTFKIEYSFHGTIEKDMMILSIKAIEIRCQRYRRYRVMKNCFKDFSSRSNPKR